MPNDTLVPTAVFVSTNGEPGKGKGEQESPTFTAPAQLVFAEPGPIAVTVNKRLACEVPLPANCTNGLLAANTPVIGVFFANSIASFGEFGEASRHPAVPRTPLGHPANIKDVPFATSPFHGGPAGFDDGSVLIVIEVAVYVIVPPEPVSRVPIITADAGIAEENSRTTAEPSTAVHRAVDRLIGVRSSRDAMQHQPRQARPHALDRVRRLRSVKDTDTPR